MEVHATLSHADWVMAYLTVWQGMLGLTEKELELTAALCERHMHLSSSVRDEELLAELLLNAGGREQMREKTGMNPNNLQNYLKSLREKGVLKQVLGKDSLNPKLIPRPQITFSFTVIE